MRLTRYAYVALVGLSLSSAVALAQTRRPQEFQAPREMSEEEIAAAKERSKSNLHSYGKDATAEVSPVPWMAIGLIGLVFLVAAPFALRAYRDTASEIRERTVGGGGGGGVPKARRPPASPPVDKA